MKKLIFGIILFVIFLLVILLFTFPWLSAFLSELSWLSSVGYAGVFFRKIVLALIAFAAPFLAVFAGFQIWLAFGGIRKSRLLGVIVWAISLGFGVIGMVHWRELFYQPFGISSGFSDPFFHLDSYFYMMGLPLVRTILMLLFMFFMALFVLDLIVRHGGEKGIVQDGRVRFEFLTMFLFTLMVLSGLALIASNIPETLVSQPHGRLGVDFTVFYGNMLGLFLWMVMVLLVLVMAIFRSFSGIKTSEIILFSLLILGFLPVLTQFYPFLLNQLYVKPNELTVQRQFVKDRVSATRQAYSLAFTPSYFPKFTSIKDGLENGVSSLRIWDSAPYEKVIGQIQSIKTYFDFFDVDADAYSIETNPGRTNLVQLAISARELNTSALQTDALNWDNLHLRYTHGYGVVASPVHLIDKDGSPVFWVKDLENTAQYSNLAVAEPQIYFGELTTNYIIVRTKADEFEYTSSTNRMTSHYRLDRGVKIGGFFSKLLFSTVFKEKNIFLSQYLTKDSRILFHREIHDRVKRIFPYLSYDGDAIISVINGKLFWIIDAYTTSSRYPLAEKTATPFGDLNAVRNSVKVTVDAYSGDVRYYLTDPSDPIALTYQALFPNLFQKKIPAGLEEHFRYPYHYLKIQSDMLCRYHVDNEDSFYNGDDMWEIPKQVNGDVTTNFEPYYMIALFETNQTGALSNCRPHFSAVQPFNPRGRENLSSWVLAYYDHGLKLALNYAGDAAGTYGPMQINSRLNQDDKLSSLFTLWGQKGSKVIRGSVRFVPLNGSLAYVVPIFLEAEQTGMPQLMKIAGIYNGSVSIGANYQELVQNMVRADTSVKK